MKRLLQDTCSIVAKRQSTVRTDLGSRLPAAGHGLRRFHGTGFRGRPATGDSAGGAGGQPVVPRLAFPPPVPAHPAPQQATAAAGLAIR